jgi:hypothetical protein
MRTRKRTRHRTKNNNNHSQTNEKQPAVEANTYGNLQANALGIAYSCITTMRMPEDAVVIGLQDVSRLGRAKRYPTHHE